MSKNYFITVSYEMQKQVGKSIFPECRILLRPMRRNIPKRHYHQLSAM
ncbi:hypothetical protein CSC35_4368 [Enterobacter hormaechei]|nr:hypothetical protein CSC35_4368 [Enterobacter hormaechei]